MFLAALRRRFALVLVAGFGFFAPATAQHAPAQLDSAQILHRIEKLTDASSRANWLQRSSSRLSPYPPHQAQPPVLSSGEVRP